MSITVSHLRTTVLITDAISRPILNLTWNIWMCTVTNLKYSIQFLDESYSLHKKNVAYQILYIILVQYLYVVPGLGINTHAISHLILWYSEMTHISNCKYRSEAWQMSLKYRFITVLNLLLCSPLFARRAFKENSWRLRLPACCKSRAENSGRDVRRFTSGETAVMRLALFFLHSALATLFPKP